MTSVQNKRVVKNYKNVYDDSSYHLPHVAHVDNLLLLSILLRGIQSHILALVITHEKLENRLRPSKVTS